MTTAKAKRPFSVLGVGAAACVACCAGPILGFIAATGLLTAGGIAVFGAIGLLIAMPGIALVIRRRRKPSTCAPNIGSVTIAAPRRRSEAHRRSALRCGASDRVTSRKHFSEPVRPHLQI